MPLNVLSYYSFLFNIIFSNSNFESLMLFLMVLQKVSYMAERVVGTGSFGVVFQVCHLPSFGLMEYLVTLYTWKITMLGAKSLNTSSITGKMLGNW